MTQNVVKIFSWKTIVFPKIWCELFILNYTEYETAYPFSFFEFEILWTLAIDISVHHKQILFVWVALEIFFCRQVPKNFPKRKYTDDNHEHHPPP